MDASRQLLTPQELAAYELDGQVTAGHRLPTDLLAELTAAVEALIGQNPEVRPEALSGAHVPRNADTGVRGRPELLDCARHPDLLDMAEQLLGPDLIVWGSHVFAKPAGDGRGTRTASTGTSSPRCGRSPPGSRSTPRPARTVACG
jgi:hypothetical protein